MTSMTSLRENTEIEIHWSATPYGHERVADVHTCARIDHVGYVAFTVLVVVPADRVPLDAEIDDRLTD